MQVITKRWILNSRSLGWIGYLMLIIPCVAEELKLSELFSDNAVLQRDKAIPIWGWNKSGSQVTIKFAGQNVSTTTNEAGKWSATLQALKISKNPQEMTVISGDQKIVRKNILVGDVWLCGGQSNMEMSFTAKRLNCDMPDFVKPDDVPMIRHLKVSPVKAKKVGKEAMETPQSKFQQGQIQGGWVSSNAESYKKFTATGFFFAYTIAKEVDVPIGLLNITQGNTRIGSWVSSEGIASVEHKVPRESFRAVYSETPSTNYNTQISPAAGFAIKGAIWYQGEANGKDGDEYSWKMKALIDGWRKAWGQGDFPFYYVQLPSYEAKRAWWPPIREAQRKAMNLFPNTGMVVLTDAGDTSAEFPINLHPRNKYVVGQRLALWALANDYGKKNLVHSGPLYRSVVFKDNKATVSFDHVGGGLIAAKKSSSRSIEPPSPVDEVIGFMIAGDDKKWSVAKAEIHGEKIILTSSSVSKPVAVRYLYTLNTDHGTLYNKEGLPASPFRTDNWKK